MEPEVSQEEPNLDEFMAAEFDKLEAADETPVNPVAETEPVIGETDEIPKEAAPDEAAPLETEPTAEKDAEDSEPAEAIAAPMSMSAEDREKFDALPPESQKWLSDREQQREADYSRKTTELAERGKSYDRLEQVIAPRRPGFAVDGMDDATAVSQLFALSDMASQDLLGFTRYLFNARGVPLSALTEPSAGDIPADPQMMALQQRMHGLENHLTQQQAQAEDRQANANQAIIGEFAEKHPYYAELTPAMVPLIPVLRDQHPELPHQDILKRAYNMAAADNADVSAKIAADNRKQTEAARHALAKKRADEAKKVAAGNVAPIGAAPQARGQSQSVDEFIGNLYDEVASA